MNKVLSEQNAFRLLAGNYVIDLSYCYGFCWNVHGKKNISTYPFLDVKGRFAEFESSIYLDDSIYFFSLFFSVASRILYFVTANDVN